MLGFVTEAGGEGGHTAILASGLELPAVVGIGAAADRRGLRRPDHRRRRPGRGDCAIRTRSAWPGTRASCNARSSPAGRAGGASAICLPETLDGSRHPAAGEHRVPARGVRLPCDAMPTESDFTAPSSCTWAPTSEPTEEDHFQAYREVVQAMGASAGGDPHARPRCRQDGALATDCGRAQSVPGTAQHSSVAAQRRICFAIQLRAILRASALGNVKILLPADHHAPGTAAGQAVSARDDGRSGGDRESRSIATSQSV